MTLTKKQMKTIAKAIAKNYCCGEAHAARLSGAVDALKALNISFDSEAFDLACVDADNEEYKRTKRR